MIEQLNTGTLIRQKAKGLRFGSSGCGNQTAMFMIIASFLFLVMTPECPGLITHDMKSYLQFFAIILADYGYETRDGEGHARLKATGTVYCMSSGYCFWFPTLDSISVLLFFFFFIAECA